MPTTNTKIYRKGLNILFILLKNIRSHLETIQWEPATMRMAFSRRETNSLYNLIEEVIQGLKEIQELLRKVDND